MNNLNQRMIREQRNRRKLRIEGVDQISVDISTIIGTEEWRQAMGPLDKVILKRAKTAPLEGGIGVERGK